MGAVAGAGLPPCTGRGAAPATRDRAFLNTVCIAGRDVGQRHGVRRRSPAGRVLSPDGVAAVPKGKPACASALRTRQTSSRWSTVVCPSVHTKVTAGPSTRSEPPSQLAHVSHLIGWMASVETTWT